MLSKPLWIKAKSLKTGGYLRGLVGFEVRTSVEDMISGGTMVKAEAPAGFNPSWLRAGDGAMTAIYKIDPPAMGVFHLTNAVKVGERYLVSTVANNETYLILCDAHGAAYVSDLDVVLIRKRLGSGAYGPPGMHVGGANVDYVGGDNPLLRSFWNQQFGKVHYPPAYECIQHGEATGTAGNFKKIKAPLPGRRPYDPAIDERGTVWGPGDAWDSERLIVVVGRAENLPTGVGWTKVWGDLVHFHNANHMGEFRIGR